MSASNRILSAGFLCLLTSLLPAEPVLAQPVRGGAVLPSRRVLSRYNLERAWWSQATLGGGRDRVRHLAADEEVLFVQSTTGIVTAFDSETGKMLWSVLLGRPDAPSQPVVSNEDVAIVVAGMDMFALDKFTGEVLWELRLPAMTSVPPAADRRQVYLGTVDGSVYAFDIRKIHELHEENLLPRWSNNALVWRYQTPATITSPPISTGRVVNFASKSGSLYSVTATERQLNFQFETDAPVGAPLAWQAERPYTGSPGQKSGVASQVAAPLARLPERLYMVTAKDFRLYCINAENGHVIWDHVSGLPMVRQPRVIADDVYLLVLGAGMSRLSAASGELHWRVPDVAEFLAATPSLIIGSDTIGNVVLLERERGGTLGVLPLRHFEVKLPNDRTDRLYMATPGGLVVCIREQGREFPLYHQNPERRPILPEFAPK